MVRFTALATALAALMNPSEFQMAGPMRPAAEVPRTFLARDVGSFPFVGPLPREVRGEMGSAEADSTSFMEQKPNLPAFGAFQNAVGKPVIENTPEEIEWINRFCQLLFERVNRRDEQIMCTILEIFVPQFKWDPKKVDPSQRGHEDMLRQSAQETMIKAQFTEDKNQKSWEKFKEEYQSLPSEEDKNKLVKVYNQLLDKDEDEGELSDDEDDSIDDI